METSAPLGMRRAPHPALTKDIPSDGNRRIPFGLVKHCIFDNGEVGRFGSDVMMAIGLWLNFPMGFDTREDCRRRVGVCRGGGETSAIRA